MVTAGVYMVARSSILYAMSPGTMEIMGLTGLATALLAAVIAIFQNDIKKILAYSTISQLGYMFLGLSVGAYTGAMFHLTTHAFFKALLFLGAGSIIHVLGGEQDIRKMGGIKKKLPVTYWTFLAGTLAISAIPPFAGFFSKDEILSKVFGFSYLLWAIALAGSLITAFYMFRLFFLSFSGKFRGTPEKEIRLHESPRVMTVPLVILAILSIAGGILNLPALMHGKEALTKFLSPVFADASRINDFSEHPPSYATEWGILAVSVGLILVTVWLAYRHFVLKKKLTLPGEATGTFIPRVTGNKFYIDELYDFIFVRPTLWLSEKLHRFVELKFIDRIVNGIGWLTVRAGNTLRYVQTGHVGFYLFMMVLGIILILLFNLVL
jgi:NADH-quinone oxidoreductase subunit L